MSTFRGPLDEIENVSVDRFDKENLKSTVYFLSHHHAGKSSYGILNDSNGFIVTCAFYFFRSHAGH